MHTTSTLMKKAPLHTVCRRISCQQDGLANRVEACTAGEMQVVGALHTVRKSSFDVEQLHFHRCLSAPWQSYSSARPSCGLVQRRVDVDVYMRELEHEYDVDRGGQSAVSTVSKRESKQSLSRSSSSPTQFSDERSTKAVTNLIIYCRYTQVDSLITALHAAVRDARYKYSKASSAVLYRHTRMRMQQQLGFLQHHRPLISEVLNACLHSRSFSDGGGSARAA